jgi:hypothetical protein
VQWSGRVFPPGRPPDKFHENTIELRLLNIGEWEGGPQGEAYPLMINLHLGYHQMRVKVQDSHMCSSIFHYDFMVMPVGLTNALVTL